MFFWLVLAVAVVFLALLVADTVRFGAPPMPSSQQERAAAIALVERRAIELARPVRVIEAGAGWGGMALALARAHPDFRITAVEGAVAPWAVCWGRAMLHQLFGGSVVSVRAGNTRQADYADIDVVVAFLGPDATQELAVHLARLPRVPQLVSVGFAVRDWRQRARIRLHDQWRSEVGLWVYEPED